MRKRGKPLTARGRGHNVSVNHVVVVSALVAAIHDIAKQKPDGP